MQKAELLNPGKYDEHFLFLGELINVYTVRLGIKDRHFYSYINKELNTIPVMRSFSYSEQGLLHNDGKPIPDADAFLLVWKKTLKSGQIYGIAIYLNSFSGLLSLILERSGKIIGQRAANRAFTSCIGKIQKKYSRIPDLRGYVPKEIEAALPGTHYAISTTFSVHILESMIDYLVNDIMGESSSAIEEKVLSESRKAKIAGQVRGLYLETLGPLGIRQFQKIKPALNINKIFAQVDYLKKKSIIKDKDVDYIKKSVMEIFTIKPERRVSVPPAETRTTQYYEEAIQRIVRVAVRRYGAAAVGKANKIKGLRVDRNGLILLIGNDKIWIYSRLAREFSGLTEELELDSIQEMQGNPQNKLAIATKGKQRKRKKTR